MNYHLVNPHSKYTISSQCFGTKYSPIFGHWVNNTRKKCPTSEIYVPPMPSSLPFPPGEAFWDIVRLESNIGLLQKEKRPIVHCDLDVIVVYDLEPMVEYCKRERYDMVFSRETWGDPLPFCSGFYILNAISLASVSFFENLLQMMKQKQYNTYSDQNTLRSFLLETPHTRQRVSCRLNGVDYINTVITIDNIRICILDMDIVTLDPMATKTQFANHINVDNVGGTSTFIRFFYESIEDLPLTCRCGKRHLGNTDVCIHQR